jgi:predicted nucleic acid-binding protein
LIRYCLDTVAYSHFKRGEETVTAILDRAEWIGVPVIVIGELCAGFAKGPRLQKILPSWMIFWGCQLWKRYRSIEELRKFSERLWKSFTAKDVQFQ